MNGTSVNTAEDVSESLGHPGKLSLILAALISCIMAAFAAASVSDGIILSGCVCFIAAASAMSYLLLFFRSLAVCVISVVSAAAAIFLGADVFLSATVVCAVAVISTAYTICHLRRLPSFRQFLWCTLCYSLMYGVAFCFLLLVSYGSLETGFTALREKFVSFAPTFATAMLKDGIDTSEYMPVVEELLGIAVVYVPAVICMAGVVSAWCMRGFFALLGKAGGLKQIFEGRQTMPPRALAVIFLIVSIFSMLFGFLPESALYALSNIVSVLTVIFAGEGVRLFFASFNKKSHVRPRPFVVIIAVSLLLFVPAVLPMTASYYGAFRVAFAPGEKKSDS